MNRLATILILFIVVAVVLASSPKLLLADDARQIETLERNLRQLQDRIDQLEGQRSTNQSAPRTSLQCDQVSATSPLTRTPYASVQIPEGPYMLTGGGCEVPGFYGHHPPIIRSRPSDDRRSWICQGADPPFIPLEFVLSAFAIYCSIQER